MYTRTQLPGFLVPVFEEFNNVRARLPDACPRFRPLRRLVCQVNLWCTPVRIAHMDAVDLPGLEQLKGFFGRNGLVPVKEVGSPGGQLLQVLFGVWRGRGRGRRGPWPAATG